MSETLQSDDVLRKAQELETYVGLSEETLKSLRMMKQDADAIISALGHKKDELSRHEQDLVEYLKKLQLVSQKADALLTPIVDQKQELETLTKKLEEGITGIEGMVQQKMDPKLGELETSFTASVDALRKEFEASITDVFEKQSNFLKNLSERVENDEQGAGSLKTALEEEKKIIDTERKDIAEVRKTIQDLKAIAEKQKQELKGEIGKLSEAFKSLSEKQKEEMTSLLEKRKQEVDGAIVDMNEKHIKVLEKDNAQLKTTLNAIVSKLGNVKFKKLLGL